MSWSRKIIWSVFAASSLLFAVSCGDNGPTDPAPIPIGRVDVTASTSTLAPPQTVQLTAIARSAAGGVLDGRTFTWSSSTTGVATVNGAGVVTAVAPGTSTITATSEGKSGTVVITVVAAGGTIATISVNLSDPGVELGQLALSMASAKDAQGAPVALGSRPLTWGSSNPTVAKVSASGIITGIGVGITSIIAIVNDNGTMRMGSAQFEVTAIAGAPLSAEVTMPGKTFSPRPVIVKLGGTIRYVFPPDAHNVIWDPGQTGAPADINALSNQTISRVFNTVGVFLYKCTLHPGMDGEVFVSP